ncbi:MAG TPA: nitroreductase family protein [Terriglobales bacterium]
MYRPFGKALTMDHDHNVGNEISLFEAMYSARAMRWLKPDPVPPQLIQRILEAAIRAPNAGNRQSWLFMVVVDADQRRRIGAIYYRVSQWVLQRYQHQGKPANQSQAEYDRMMSGGVHLYEHMGDAPVLLVPCLRISPVELPAAIPAEVRSAMTEASPWTAGASIYPAVQNIILACRALGLGTVLTTNHTIAENEVKQVLGLPAEVRTFALMPIGYPERNFGPVRRRPLTEVAMIDRYGSPFSAKFL